MKVMLLVLMLALVRCSSDVSAADAPKADELVTHEDHAACHCESKLSEPVWRYGTLCKKGELSQGHGVNKDGKQVAGCVTISYHCECKP